MNMSNASMITVNVVLAAKTIRYFSHNPEHPELTQRLPMATHEQNTHQHRDVLYQQHRLKGNRDEPEGIVSEPVVNECLPYGNRMKSTGRKTE